MNVMIDNVDFWDNFEAMKYWSHPKSYDVRRKKQEAKTMVLSGQYLGSRKMDGIWQLIIKDNNGVFHARSRNKNVDGTYQDKAQWIPSICESLNAIPNGTVLLGELYLPEQEGSRHTTSVFNCLKSKCLQKQLSTPLYFYVFDVLAWEGRSLLTEFFEKRVGNTDSYLQKLENTLGENPQFITFAKYFEGESLWSLYHNVLNCGGEGIVITKKNCKYLQGKRTARLTLKLKKELEDTIDAFYDGNYKTATRDYDGKEIENWEYWLNVKTGEKVNEKMYFTRTTKETWIPITKAYFYGWASAISFSVMKDGKPVHIGYISGITDEVKAGVVEEPEKWRGRVAELTAMEIENIDGEYSLRHGRIMRWREDGKTPDECLFDQII